MAYQTLYRTWRPRTFSEMVGQDAVVRALSNQVATKRIAHAYLFCGSRGTGKTSAARIMAAAINCRKPENGNPCLVCDNCKALKSETTLDVFEMDAASNSRVEEIREMLAKTDYPPQFVPYKVYIIDEVHMLSNAAFNALLKTLEEPPEYMVFILATTEPQKLPATILSRCQRFDFGRIAERDIVARLKLALKDGYEAEEDALLLIAASAQGSMRDAWSLMDMCLGVSTRLSEDSVRAALGAVSQDFLFAFLDALAKGDTAAALRLTAQMMKDGRDVQVFLREFNAHLRQVLAMKWTGAGTREISSEQAARLKAQAKASSADDLLFFLEKAMLAEQDARWASSPRAVLELFALRCSRLNREEAEPGKPARKAAPAPAATGKDKPSRKEAGPEPPAQAFKAQAEPEEKPLSGIIASPPEQPREAPGKDPGEGGRQGETKLVTEAEQPDEAFESGEQEHLPPEQAPDDTAAPQPIALAKTPKDAWNNLLKRLNKDHNNLHAMVQIGRYGGYEDKTFILLMDPGNRFHMEALNEEPRVSVIAAILSEEMGERVGFRAGGPKQQAAPNLENMEDENVEALAKVFGRDKIIVRKD